jgi:acetylornithine/N-succinyldiaminopimelate aminotransferase
MKTEQIEDLYGLNVSRRQSVVIERGSGVWVWDSQGRKLLDFTAGWGVTCLGHSHPLITQTIAEQAGKIIQNPNSGFTYSPARARLMQELVAVLPPGLTKLWFANSGAEANDAALKIARKVTGRQAVVALQGSFHGRTLAALSVSGSAANSARFLPRLPDHEFVPVNVSDVLRSKINTHTAAVILELIQGEGGVRSLDPLYLNQLKTLCSEHGCLLIVDEVQTGFCRTGDFFAVDRYGVRPDIMTMGKGIAGGLPFAALAMTESVAAGLSRGDHGGTYCGNPLSCAVSAEVVHYLRTHNIAARVSRQGARAIADLISLQREFPTLIKEIRGVGLMLAIELTDDALVWPLTDICLEFGLLVTPTRDAVVRLLPSLLLTDAEWEHGLQLLRSALASLWVSGQWASMQSA